MLGDAPPAAALALTPTLELPGRCTAAPEPVLGPAPLAGAGRQRELSAPRCTDGHQILLVHSHRGALLIALSGLGNSGPAKAGRAGSAASEAAAKWEAADR
jgi:hypothetical protein